MDQILLNISLCRVFKITPATDQPAVDILEITAIGQKRVSGGAKFGGYELLKQQAYGRMRAAGARNL